MKAVFLTSLISCGLLASCRAPEADPLSVAPTAQENETAPVEGEMQAKPAAEETAAAEPAPEKPAAPPGPDWSQPQYQMDYGTFIAGTIAADHPADNFALKGVAIPLGEKGKAGMVFDTELLRMSAGWVDEYLELRGTPYDGSHGPTPKVMGTQVFGTGVRPGWAVVGDDGTASFDDPRSIPHGPLPRELGRFRGTYRHGDRVVLSYEVDGCAILESPEILEEGDTKKLVRTLNVGPHARGLDLLVAELPGVTHSRSGTLAKGGHLVRLDELGGYLSLEAQTLPAWTGVEWAGSGTNQVRLRFAPSDTPVKVKIGYQSSAGTRSVGVPAKLSRFTRGGPARWTTPVITQGAIALDEAAYVVDTLTVPYENPWNSRMRIAAMDFFSDGRAAVSTWNGDVWVISGIDDQLQALHWQRFATGLFDPLGLEIVDDVVHTLGRDQITKLHDLNEDGEADFYECFNNGVLITKNFHEFAFDLQTDADGNFYFSKGGPVKPGGRGFDKIVPHHGTLLKVSADGSTIEPVVTGLRAPNGIAVGPDGTLTVGDNEGTWTPRCRLNFIPPDRRGNYFSGCVDTAHRDTPPEIYDLPVCWFPMEVDNSSGGQVWVTSDQWGPFQGDLLHLSYGTCSLYKVMLQEVDGVTQGGVVRMPLSFSSSCMRGRFHPIDKQLYVCGLRGWQTSAAQLSAVHRVRYTGRSAYLPKDMAVRDGGLELTFTDALDRELAEDVESYSIERWNYLWTERYGSPEVPPGPAGDEHIANASAEGGDWNGYKEHEEVAVQKATLSPDGKSVLLEISDIAPVMQMRVRYDLDAADGEAVRGEVFHSIHRVPGTDSGGGAKD